MAKTKSLIGGKTYYVGKPKKNPKNANLYEMRTVTVYKNGKVDEYKTNARRYSDFKNGFQGFNSENAIVITDKQYVSMLKEFKRLNPKAKVERDKYAKVAWSHFNK